MPRPLTDYALGILTAIEMFGLYTWIPKGAYGDGGSAVAALNFTGFPPVKGNTVTALISAGYLEQTEDDGLFSVEVTAAGRAYLAENPIDIRIDPGPSSHGR
ncbi:hypothetical protein [Salinibacterium sp. ZJ450]|uniref:hypothetical protein n=1 Tax=Salinibacterium sp. ZJ450 TaxID=2708338 RepID=UPI001420C1ED|nr:hypothetical protein [Salinibacterium sp. ZJ450]